MKKQSIPIIVTVLGFLVLSISGVGAVQQGHQDGSHGAVYIMTNDPAGNKVLVFNRATDGILTLSGSFAAGGKGTSGLTGTNQGGLVLSHDEKWLIVANAGSNDVAVFRVENGGLSLTGTFNSGGIRPLSVTISTGNQESGHNSGEDQTGLVYVLNAGSSESAGNIAGFSLTETGQLEPIAGSIHSFTTGIAPAQIQFNPTGRVLVVTLKDPTNMIDTYAVDENGVASAPTSYVSNGINPFGFDFAPTGQLIVSEAGTSSVSSYAVSSQGVLSTISGAVPDGQKAACWLVVTSNGRYAYTANAGSGTISSYTINHNGSIKLLDATAASNLPTDLDMALGAHSHFLYVFAHGTNSIEGFSVNHDGSLELVTTVTGLPATADGLAAN